MNNTTKIKKYLESNGIKQRWLLKQINNDLEAKISETMLSYWITGNRPMPSIIKDIITTVLKVKKEILFD